MECDTFDQPGKGFAILGADVGGHAIHDASSPVKMPLPALEWVNQLPMRVRVRKGRAITKGAQVHSGSQADILHHTHLCPLSGVKRTSNVCFSELAALMSALGGKADIGWGLTRNPGAKAGSRGKLRSSQLFPT